MTTADVARLIAAAPDLLAGLEGLLQIQASDLRPEETCGPTKTAALVAARAAIAKATEA